MSANVPAGAAIIHAAYRPETVHCAPITTVVYAGSVSLSTSGPAIAPPVIADLNVVVLHFLSGGRSPGLGHLSTRASRRHRSKRLRVHCSPGFRQDWGHLELLVLMARQFAAPARQDPRVRPYLH
jgi:hypothetical protein